MSAAPDCIFCKIVEGKIPCKKIDEDQELLVFHDIAPWAPVHFLVIPKQHISSMADLNHAHADLMGKIMTRIPQWALEQGCRPYPQGGYRVIINTGEDGGQEVPHLHIHVIGGARPWKKG